MDDKLPDECGLPAQLCAIAERETVSDDDEQMLRSVIGWRALVLRSLRTVREARAGARERVDEVRDC